jgi:hypothetical protein
MHFRKFLAIPTLLFVGWGLYFIFITSAIGADGKRYFMLFDDAMISMRYAWNLAHGYGLVWYPGNFIQGYSNLLMTLLMALPAMFLDRSATVLAVQLFCLFLVPATAFLMERIVDRFLLDEDVVYRNTIRLLVFCAVLFYYPARILVALRNGDGPVDVFDGSNDVLRAAVRTQR